MHVGGRGVARLTGVHHENLAAGSGEDQGSGQAGCAAADDHYVISVHAARLRLSELITYERCCSWETGVG